MKIGGSINETFNLGASKKKSAKIGAYIGRQSPDVARFSQILLTDCRATVGLGDVTVELPLTCMVCMH